MNYRHLYHAGNFADVFKHVVLVDVVERLKQKDAPFRVLDTHAGVGRYDLASPPAQRTGEAADGIGRLDPASPWSEPVRRYLDLVRSFNPDGGLRWYPGSPRLARALLRPQDRLELVELHDEDVEELRHEFRGDRQTSVHHRDAYQALKALLPPDERRGAVLIDPPFETRDEFERIVRALGTAYRKWPTGVYAIWYPIKDPATIWRFQEALAQAGLRKVLALEFLVLPPDDPARLNGCGMTLVNPPWRLDATMEATLPELLAALGRQRQGSTRVDWIVPE